VILNTWSLYFVERWKGMSVLALSVRA
jgi:hypothetical protein